MKGSESRTVLIAGGGITGLTAALCLARIGFRIDLFEKAEGFDTIGAGLQISPNAFHVLAQLGLGDGLKRVATGPLSIRVMSGVTGREITAIPLGATAIERYGAPYLLAHRADLHQVLASAVHDNPDIALHLNARMEDFSVHSNGITALVYKDGQIREYHSRALVAADGVWSTLRKNCFDAPPARHTGLTAWRCLVAAEQLPGSRDLENTQLWLAPNAHAVSYPVRGGRYLNLVVITRARSDEEPLGGKWASTAYATEVRDALKGWSAEFTNLLEYRTRWTRWPLYRAPVPTNWSKGPTALAGDAAHAMLPFAAQGAAMGIEDAWFLADAMARHRASGDFSEAMKQYQAARKRRVNRVNRMAQANRLIYHLPSPLAMFRDLGMAILGGNRLLSRQDWLYGWRPSNAVSPEEPAESGSASAVPE